jgi:hypothetical protein
VLGRIPAAASLRAGEWHVRSTDDLVAWIFAGSASAPHLFADRLDDFERDLRVVLASCSPSGRYAQRAPFTQLRIWMKT